MRRLEAVPPGVVQLIDSWAATPAYVEGRFLDILAANRLAVALSPVFTPGTNMLRRVLLDPAVNVFHGPDWEDNAARLIGSLRAAAGADLDDPRLTELVAELSEKSELFRRHWPRHDVRPQPGGGPYHVHHPAAGYLELRYDKFAVLGAEHLIMVVHQGPPEALARLAALL